MTERKHFKERVRARQKKTSESYTTARDQLIRQAISAEKLEPDYLKQVTGMRNEAVLAKTGRDWNQWVALLDAAQAAKMSHAAIARFLKEKQGLSSWWAQMVTVGYERIRGLRAIHEKSDGFAMNKSKTLPVPLSTLFQAWDDPSVRRLWLDEPIQVRRSTPQKSMRIRWSDGESHLDVYFYAKGPEKSLVTVEHSRLPDQPAVELLKKFWSERLKALSRQFGV